MLYVSPKMTEVIIGDQNRTAGCDGDFDPFAGRETIPKYVLEGLIRLKKQNLDERRRHRQQSASTLLQMLDETRAEEAVFRSEQPQHVRMVQKDKQHVLLLKLAGLAGDPDVETNKQDWVDNLKLGTPVVGDIPATSKWRGQIKKAKRTLNEVKPSQQRKKPPAHMSEDDRVRLWNEFEDEKFGGGTEIKFEEAQGPITYVFGVNQGVESQQDDGSWKFEKLRRIMDFRPLNEGVGMMEKLRLVGHLSLVMMIQLLVATADQVFPAVWGGKDVSHDAYGHYRMPESEYDRSLWRKVIETGKAFAPFLAKLDFRRYYFQFAVRTPKLNVAAVWDPFMKKYRFFEMPACQFGSLFSIFYACRVSELLSRIATVLLCVVTVIYIDDSIIMSREDIAEDAALLGLLFSILGFDPSSNKEECMIVERGGTKTYHEALTILGLAYRRVSDVVFTISPTIEKALKVRRLCDEAIEALKDGRGSIKMLEPIVGLLIFMVYFSGSKELLGKVLRLSKWTVPKIFYNAIREKRQRARLQVDLEDLAIEAQRIRPLVLSPERLDGERKKIWTDASLEKSVSGLGGLLAQNETQIRDARAFSIFIDEKDWVIGGRKGSIQTFEALAVLIALRMWKDDLKSHRFILHIDNIAVLFGIARCSHRDPVVAVLTELIVKEASNLPIMYSLYIKSKDNPSDALTRENLKRAFLSEYKGNLEDAREVANKIRGEVEELLIYNERREEETMDRQNAWKSAYGPSPATRSQTEKFVSGKRRRWNEENSEEGEASLEAETAQTLQPGKGRKRESRGSKKRKTNQANADRRRDLLQNLPEIRARGGYSAREEIAPLGSEAFHDQQGQETGEREAERLSRLR